MNSFIKKAILISLTLFFFMDFVLFSQPAMAGGMPVFDGVHIGKTVWDSLKTGWRWMKEDMFKTLRDQAAKRIIDNLVDQTVEWIQGGGKPKFVDDWDGFLKNAGDIAFDSVYQDVNSMVLQPSGLPNICEPFDVQVKIGLLPVGRFKTRIACTMEDVEVNLQNFYDDFRDGDWIGYTQSWQPSNNYYGVMLSTYDEAMMRIAKSETAARNEAVASKGFLSVKRCVEYDKPTVKEECVYNSFLGQDQCTSIETPGKCLKEEIVTPGDVVGESFASAITSDQKWGENIQSWSASLLNALLNRGVTEIIDKGLKGMDTKKTTDDYQDIIDMQNEREKKEMVKEPQKMVAEWDYIYKRKNDSLSYITQQQGILKDLQKLQLNYTPPPLPFSCLPEVANSEIDGLQPEIDRLNAEVQDLSAKMAEANNVISSIRTSDFNNVRTRAVTQENYLAFLDKYQTDEFMEAMLDGSQKKAADNEKAQRLSSLQSIQDRFNTCKTAIDALKNMTP